MTMYLQLRNTESKLKSRRLRGMSMTYPIQRYKRWGRSTKNVHVTFKQDDNTLTL